MSCLNSDTKIITHVLRMFNVYSCWITVSDHNGGALWAFVVPFVIVIAVGIYIHTCIPLSKKIPSHFKLSMPI